MSILKSKNLNRISSLFAKILKQGPIPQHVAFIMDGNRRFARDKHVEIGKGHFAGYKKLLEVWNWCVKLGVREVTFYAFSIENFKRPQTEVMELLELIKRSFEKMWNEIDDYKGRGVCVRVFGNLDLFPKDFQNTLAKIVLDTKDCNKSYFNFALAYTGREEMHQAVQNMLEGVELGMIEPDDITEDLLQKCLYTSDSLDLDLMVRTSGEARLSDFFLWQSSYSVLMFISSLWPSLTVWELLSLLISYQKTFDKTKEFKEKAEKSKKLRDVEFIGKKLMEAKPTCKNNNYNSPDDKCQITEAEIFAYKEARENRLNQFYLHLEKKRNDIWKSMLLDEIN